MHFSLVKKFIVVVPLVLALGACGGGSSDKKSPITNTPASSVVASSITASSVGVSSIAVSSTISSAASSSSVITLFSSSSSSVSPVSSSAASQVTVKVEGKVSLAEFNSTSIDNDTPEEVLITVSLLNDKEEVATANTRLLEQPTLSDDEPLAFAVNIAGADATHVVVHISKQGFTDYSRRFDIASEVDVRAILSPLPMSQITVSNAVTVSGEEVDGFSFSVADNGSGQVIEPGAGTGAAELSVFIPQAALPASTTVLDVQMQAFDPNNERDAAYFPGAYEDSEGNKLLSVAFNYTDIVVDGGISLKQIGLDARSKRIALQKSGGFQKAAENTEEVIINRSVPYQSCLSLATLGDSSVASAGFQIPVYTYNPVSGVWDLLGQGTLYANNELVEAGFTGFDCESVTYVLEIKVSNEIFISNWWNLDYPLVFSEPVTLCAKLKLVDNGSKPIAGATVYVSDDDALRNFSAENFVTDTQGEVNVKVISLDGSRTDITANLTLFSTTTWQAISKEITLSESCENTPPVTLAFSVPELCKVEGTILDTLNTPVANSLVFSSNTSVSELFMPAYGFSDAQGKYSLDVMCGQPYKLNEYLSWTFLFFSGKNPSASALSFNVNNVIEPKETSDNSKTSVLQDLVIDRTKPNAYVYPNSGDISELGFVFFYRNTDYPLTYNFKITEKATNNVVGTYSGEVTAEDLTDPNDSGFNYSTGYITIKHGLPLDWIPQNYKVTGDITDNKGNTGVVIDVYSIYVD